MQNASAAVPDLDGDRSQALAAVAPEERSRSWEPRPGSSGDAAAFDELLEIASRLGVVARAVAPGEPIAGGRVVSLVISGSVGLIVPDSKLLATIADAGDIIGVEALAGLQPPFRGVWLSPGVVMEMAAEWREEPGSLRRVRWIGEAAGRLQHALAREISCRLEHGARSRLADLLCAMTQHGRLDKVLMTQAQLAELLGLQRTSVCAAMDGFKTRGVAKAIRGRIEIRDFAELRRMSCGCWSHRG